MAGFEFTPTIKQTAESNMFGFMQRHGIKTLNGLSAAAAKDPEWFWESVSGDIGIVWDRPYSEVLDSSRGPMWPKWFVGGKTNIYRSSVERFTQSSPQNIAYTFLSENGASSTITYAELDRRVSALANGLMSAGVGPGDVVAIYMPMIQEAILAILASAKIGAIQTVIFSGYGAESLHVRLCDCNAKVLFVCDGFQRRGRPVSAKATVRQAVRNTAVEQVIVVPYMGVDRYGDLDGATPYGDLVMPQEHACRTVSMDSEDPLFIMYTSGTTGRPKGVIHTHGGFSVFAGYQAAYLTDMRMTDTLFWPADIGWITGLVWNVYGLLLTGASAVIYDGALDFPDAGRTWQILSDTHSTIFGTSPTAARMIRRTHSCPPRLNHLRGIVTTGEPLDEDSWWWLFEKVGGRRMQVINLSGGTEIGGAMLSVLPGMGIKPSTVGTPIPGMSLDAVDDDGRPVRGRDGYLVIKSPWPAMTRGLLNDDSRYLETYWSRFEGIWFHGDYVLVDKDGLWYMRGRADDVINVSGHRMSTAEIEDSVLSHPGVSDVASVAVPDNLTGQAIVVLVVAEDGLEGDIADLVAGRIGRIARPRAVIQVSDLPRTRTGKTVRRAISAKLLGDDPGDLSPVENPQVLDEIPLWKDVARGNSA